MCEERLESKRGEDNERQSHHLTSNKKYRQESSAAREDERAIVRQ